MDKNELHKILSKPFDHEAWLEVLQSVFGVRELFKQPQSIPLSGTKKAKAAFELGNFTTSDDRVIGLYKVEMMPGIGLERNKVGLGTFLSIFRNTHRYDVDGALIVFEQGEKWRLSYVSEIKVLNADGEVVSQATEPKRYTYLLGPGEKVLTPANQLSKLKGKSLTLEDIRNAFSVEALNEAFYKIIAEQFYQLIGGTTGKSKNAKTYDGLLKLPSVSKENRRVFQEFVVRLIGRTVFCWFLKVKKSDDGKPLVPESLLSSTAVKTNANYYHTILEPLFFQTLNTPMEKRISHLPEGCKNVPFLNGGLFEQGPDDFYPKGCPWHQPNKKTALSRRGVTGSKHLNTLVIPDEWFENLFSELEKYNFTIDENSVIDVEVSVDPEMLGRIFENLLAEIDPDSGETARKATGSFYTPREIVDYMATESLVQYLHHKTSLAQDKLRPLFKMTDEAPPEFAAENAEAILDALDKVKILDPACGSGAFPMGVLQKMLMALRKLDPECTWWIQRQIDQVENTILKKQITEKLSGASVEYARKMGIIQNSLFGVDIQPIAAEISKLRCFLTLVVDEHIDESKPNRGIEPLPNLEFKFIAANTLLKLPEEQDLGGLFNANEDLDALQKLRNKYLQSCGEEKAKIKEDFGKIQAGIYKQQMDYLGKSIDVNSKAYLVSTWNPFSHVRKDSFGEKASWFDPEWMFGEKEFDVVIGNPPYLRVQGIRDNDSAYADELIKKFKAATGSFDLYAVFLEKAMTLINSSGLVNFIMPVKWTHAAFGSGLRDVITKTDSAYKIINFGAYQVFNASTYTGLQWFKANSDHLKYYELDRDVLSTDELSKYLNGIKAESESRIPKEKLGKDRWVLSSRDVMAILDKLDKHPRRMSDVFEKIFTGLQTSLDSVYFLYDCKENGNHVIGFSKQLNSKVELEKSFVKPLLKGDDVHRYEPIETNKVVLFPYKLSNGTAQLYTEKELKNHFPLAYDYLKKCERVLRDREKGRLKNDKFWYRYIYPKNLNLFQFEKLVAPEISHGGNFSYDKNGGFYSTTKIYGYIKKDMIKEDYKFWLGLLNSRLFWFFIQQTGYVLRGGYFTFKTNYIHPFPVPSSIPIKTMERIETLVDKILSLKKGNPQADTTALEAQIDELVFDLYELTAAERKIVLQA